MTRAERESLAYALSTMTVDLSGPGETVKWGHLSPASCEILAGAVAGWLDANFWGGAA
jgi:hypothetical protein